MSKLSNADKRGFETFPLKTVRDYGRIAVKGAIEVWASKRPATRTRYARVTFEALRIVARREDGSRQTEPIELPITHRSDLGKVLAFLADRGAL